MNSSCKILYLGDIVGRPAREFIVNRLEGIKKLRNVDVVVANGENATSGAGITRQHCELLHEAGVDVITLGDHAWDRHGFERDIDALDYVCRPANLPEECPGRDFVMLKKNGVTIGVCIALGRHFMKLLSSCPFKAVDRLWQKYRSETDIFISEIHAEATSEKVAFAWNFDGKVSAVVGSHTHIQTADEKILPNGTAYITDLGMCGPHKSVIGREISPVLYSMKFSMPQKFEVASGDVQLNGVMMTFDVNSGLPTKIMRFSEKHD